MLVAAASLGFAASTAGPAAADESKPKQLFGVQAGAYGKTTLSQNHFTYAVGPGARVEDAIFLLNFTDHPIDLDVYGADLLSADGGGTAPAQKDQPQHGVGAWLTLDRTRATIAPHDRQRIGFRLVTPASLQPGDYLGAMVASLDAGRTTNGLVVQTRAALLVKVTVPGVLAPRLTVGRLRAHKVDGGEAFDVTVRNRGNALLTLNGAVNLGAHRALVGLQPGGIYVIPGGQTRLRALWRKPPRFGAVSAVAAISADAGGKPFGTFHSAPLHLRFLDWILVGELAALLLALVSAVLVAVRRRRRWLGWLGQRRAERRAVAAFRAARRAGAQPEDEASVPMQNDQPVRSGVE
jgi:hypothetical protein